MFNNRTPLDRLNELLKREDFQRQCILPAGHENEEADTGALQKDAHYKQLYGAGVIRCFPTSIEPHMVIIHSHHEMKKYLPGHSQQTQSLLVIISTCGQLQDSLPAWKFDDLVILNLSFNSLSGNLPDFGNMPKIRFLNLSNNNFNGALINLTALPSLIHLNVANNKFDGGVTTISWLLDLEYADLSFNELSGGIPAITHLKKLKHLWLQNNNFDGGFDPQPRRSLTSLRLNNNRFSGIFNMENLTLTEIDIYGNLFKLEPAKETAKESDDQSIRNSVKMEELFPTGAYIISQEYGFLPRHMHSLMNPKMEGVVGYEEWSTLIHQLPALLLTPLLLRERIDSLPRLATTKDTDFYALLRVSCMASNLCHVYYYHGNPQKLQPPQTLKDTWLDARASLGWSVQVKHHQQTDNAHYLSYIDFIVANCQPVDSINHETMSKMKATEWIELMSDPTKLRVLVPTAPVKVIVPTPPGPTPGRNQEDTFYMVQTSMLAVSADLPSLVVQLQMLGPELIPKAAEVGEKLKQVLDIVRNVTAMFERISLHEGNVDAVTSLFFGRMFASTVIPAKFVKNPETGQYDAFRSKNGHLVLTPGPGGQASPFFALMDSFLNRKHYGTNLGHHSSLHMNSYPADWRNFLIAVRSPHKRGYGHFEEYLRYYQENIEEITELKYCFDLYSSIVEAYLGDNGLLARHLLKLHGYLTGMFRTGREGTIGDAKAGSILNRTEDLLYKSIESSRLERLKDSLPPYSRFVSVEAFKEISPGVWRATLTVPTWCDDNPEAGGHILLHPKNVLDTYRDFSDKLDEMQDQTEIIRHLLSNSSWVRHLQLWKRNIDKITNLSTFLELGDLFGVEVGQIKTKIRSLMPLRPRIYSIPYPPVGTPITKTLNLFIRSHTEGVVYKMMVHLSEATDENQFEFPVVFPASPPLLLTLKNETAVPIVLFSAGTGISPFLSFIEQSSRPVYFVWFTNICSSASISGSFELHLRAACEPLNGTSHVQCLVVCSSPHGKTIRPGEKFEHLHVESRIERTERMQNVFSEGSNRLFLLKKLIHEENCDIRVCGSSGFVHSVITFLGSPGIGEGSLQRWIGSGRLKVEAFSSSEPRPGQIFHPHEILQSVLGEGPIPLMVLNGGVYEVTQQLKHIHPGGAQIFDFYLGTDASKAFNQIKHNVSNNVLGMMQPYQRGRLIEDSSNMRPCSDFNPSSFRVLQTDYDSECKKAWSMMEIRNAIHVEYQLHDVLDSMGIPRKENLHAAEAFKSYLRFTITHLPELIRLFHEIILFREDLFPRNSFVDRTEGDFENADHQKKVQTQVYNFLDNLVQAVSNSLKAKLEGLKGCAEWK
ncbi:hypothetical protein CcCBS67573_g02891 [Chytriomyces confervae]|uniref:FAD-binding FR-type domain-containing protein n=1 Tax=Chytriomyces confervae TaxID=246404 RepID=A0A507FHH8_9FUNG|nr:hypothetical protein CcCBS67573_g02891 [Chytriomyces confervae]